MARPPPPRKGPKGPDTGQVTARAEGALWGLAVGDALGGPFDGKRLEGAPFPTLCTTPRSVTNGQVGTNVQLAAALAWSLDQNGRFALEATAQRYRDWFQLSKALGQEPDPDVRASLEALSALGAESATSAKLLWHRTGRKAQSTAALTRAVPLAVFLAMEGEARPRAVLDECALTHVDPHARLAAVALAGAIAAAVGQSGPKPPDAAAMLDGARADLAVAGALAGREAEGMLRPLTAALDDLREDLGLAQKPDPMLYDSQQHLLAHGHQLRLPFRLAFWELCHAPTFEAGLTDVVNRGGQARINAALAGALLGALRGVAAIPPAWREAVATALSDTRQKPLWETYHPRFLIRASPPVSLRPKSA